MLCNDCATETDSLDRVHAFGASYDYNAHTVEMCLSMYRYSKVDMHLTKSIAEYERLIKYTRDLRLNIFQVSHCNSTGAVGVNRHNSVSKPCAHL